MSHVSLACHVSPRMGLKGFFQDWNTCCRPAVNQVATQRSRSTGSLASTARFSSLRTTIPASRHGARDGQGGTSRQGKAAQCSTAHLPSAPTAWDDSAVQSLESRTRGQWTPLCGANGSTGLVQERRDAGGGSPAPSSACAGLTTGSEHPVCS